MENSNPDTFIKEWLNHLSINYQTEVKVDDTINLDVLIQNWDIGILIAKWEKPISVQIINKAIIVKRKMNLSYLYLVANEISNSAQNTLERFGEGIQTIHPNGLSELAMQFTMKQNSSNELASA